MIMKSKPKDKSPTVVVAMSGGVDSSLAALLLNQKGYQVVGASMKLWDFPEGEKSTSTDDRCGSDEALNHAREVCRKIGIPHHVVDIRDDFKDQVISDFVKEYLIGRTPNPCIICNTRIKWGSLWRKAKALGADFISTGHYARIQHDQERKRFILLRGVDTSRDQSYALWGLSQQDLSRTIFPLGEMTKKQVRSMAKKEGLKVAEREDSQEICFVADDDYPRFIREWHSEGTSHPKGKVEPGPIFNLKGEELGEHKGVPFYTIGQRRGLGISASQPLYVVRIDAKKNAIYVGENEELFSPSFVVSNVNWVSLDKPDKEIRCEIKIRYQHVPQKGTIYPLTHNRIMVKFDQAERAVTPGQSAVFYQGELVLGGGIIDKVAKDETVKGLSELSR
jgi:tRNA-specific 2-thiouridylase